jgi:hypothetical protein
LKSGDLRIATTNLLNKSLEKLDKKTQSWTSYFHLQWNLYGRSFKVRVKSNLYCFNYKNAPTSATDGSFATKP